MNTYDYNISDIVNKYSRHVAMLSYTYTKNIADAEDIAQDSFVNFWNQKENVSQHEVAIKNYLYLTAKNLCLNQIRHNNIVKDYQAKNQFSIFDHTEIVNAIVSSEISSRIYQAIETLPAQCREVTRMAYIQGLKNQEIADNLQISINSVRVHKQRAIHLLRDKLSKKDLLLMIIFEKKLNSF